MIVRESNPFGKKSNFSLFIDIVIIKKAKNSIIGIASTDIIEKKIIESLNWKIKLPYKRTIYLMIILKF